MVNKRHIALLTALIVLSSLSVVSGIMIGTVHASISDLINYIKGRRDIKGYIILDVRIPRTLGAFFGGAALAVSGLLLQTYFRNPLAGPYVLGISSAASFGVALYILAGVGLGYFGLVGAAFFGSLIAIAVILALASKVRSAVTLLIAGLMFGYIFSALENILITVAQSQKVHEFVLWTLGSFSGITWNDLRTLTIYSIPAIVAALLLAKPLNALLLGEDYAKSMGVNVRFVRIVLITVASFLAALVTAFAGIVAFIGLAVPHIAKLIFKTSDHRILIPGVVFCGALITVFCDVVSRVLLAPVELPISVVTSLFGAPIVIALVVKRRTI